jgi:hypothetical protein
MYGHLKDLKVSFHKTDSIYRLPYLDYQVPLNRQERPLGLGLSLFGRVQRSYEVGTYEIISLEILLSLKLIKHTIYFTYKQERLYNYNFFPRTFIERSD